MAFYRYGSSLLYQAQDNADVFGGPMQGGGGDDAEAPESDGKENDELDVKGKGPAAAVGGASMEEEGEKEEDGEQQGEDNEQGEDGDRSAAADLASDLQLAWENLETAKIIWSRDAKTNASDLAQVQTLLGDIKLEDEDWDAALAEYDAALEHLNMTGTPNGDRRRADIQFKRSLVLEFMEQPNLALEAVLAAKECLIQHKAMLAAKVDACDDVAEQAKLENELINVATLVEEIKYKVEELEETVKETEATKEMIKTALASTMAGGQGAAAAAGGGGGGGEAGPFGGITEQSGFDKSAGGQAPAVIAAIKEPAKEVQNLGVVGRGTKRINLAPVSNAPSTAKPSTTTEPDAKKKRSLEDLMGGSGGGGDDAVAAAGGTGFGFGGEKKEADAAPAALPAFLTAQAVQATYKPADREDVK